MNCQIKISDKSLNPIKKLFINLFLSVQIGCTERTYLCTSETKNYKIMGLLDFLFGKQKHHAAPDLKAQSQRYASPIIMVTAGDS